MDPPNIVNMENYYKAATKIGALMRGYLVRSMYKLRKENRIKLLYSFRERIEERIVQIRILKVMKTDIVKDQHQGDILVCGFDFMIQKPLKSLCVPPVFLKNIRNWKDIMLLVSNPMFYMWF